MGYFHHFLLAAVKMMSHNRAMNYEKANNKAALLRFKAQEKGGIIERMEKKAKASVFRITARALEDSIEKYLASGGTIKKY